MIEVKVLCNTQTDADTVVELLTLLQKTHKDIRIMVADHSEDIRGPDVVVQTYAPPNEHNGWRVGE